MNRISDLRETLTFIENHVSGACFSPKRHNDKISAILLFITLDHSQGVCALLEGGVHTSAMSLLRIQFESCIRGLWFDNCASVDDVNDFLKNDEIKRNGSKLTLQQLINDVEREANLGQLFTAVRNDNNRIFNSFVHGGAYPILYSFKKNTIAHQYEVSEINELARLSCMFACMAFNSILGIVELDGKTEIENELLKMIEPWIFKSQYSLR